MHVPLDPRSKTLGPLSVLHHGLGRQRCKLLQRQNSEAETKNNSDAGKSTPWPGATPFCPRFSGPKRPAGFRVAPGHSFPPPRLQFGWQVCHPQSAATSCQNCFDDLRNPEDFQHSSSMLSQSPHPQKANTLRHSFLAATSHRRQGSSRLSRLSRLSTATRRTFVRP